MRIHVFNPEHDLALASNLDHFTAPHAGRDLRHDLGFLPALWAGPDEGVLVEDREAAERAWHKLGVPMKSRFVTPEELPQLVADCSFSLSPWGWDRAIRGEFLRLGAPVDRLPDDTFLNYVRQTSHRSWAAEHLLRPLRQIEGTIGEAETACTFSEVRRFLSVRHRIVLKAPWSSSGRGVRYVSDGNRATRLTPQLEGWIENILSRQGGILMEPYYNKVMDFGIEFTVEKRHRSGCLGLSIFNTNRGAYTGNLIAEEKEKRERVAKYLDPAILENVQLKIEEILTTQVSPLYGGGAGVDMMIVNDGGKLRLHPCVELNLRRTMGMVALEMFYFHKEAWGSMRVAFKNGKYCLEIGAKSISL